MTRNLGWLDRSVRLLIALLFLLLYLLGTISGIPAFFLLVFGAALVLTSAMGVCPIYLRCGLNTFRGKGHAADHH